MNNKKGFTLIEVLAIIILLGIIIVIIAPKVVNTIRNSKKKSYEASVNNIVKSLNSIAIDKKANLVSFEGCSIDFDNDVNTCTDLKYSGELPTSGSITVDKDGNVNGSVGYGNNIFEIRNNKYTIISSGTEFVFDYTGGEQTFKVVTSGYYKLETWGAQGGNKGGKYGGYGGYSTGDIVLTTGDILYINVGGNVNGEYNSSYCVGSPNGYCFGGYNGGGSSWYVTNEKWGSGGGATHIALKSGLLSTLNNDVDKILIVSGGGGGAYSAFVGGSAGGYIGNNGYLREAYAQSIGGTQSAGGTGQQSGSFGLGGSISNRNNGTGGGAGFYGAGSALASSSGGGSSYIGNSRLINKYMSCFQCQESNDVSTKTISVNDESKVTEEPISGNPKKGNGYARITYLGQSID